MATSHPIWQHLGTKRGWFCRLKNMGESNISNYLYHEFSIVFLWATSGCLVRWCPNLKPWGLFGPDRGGHGNPAVGGLAACRFVGAIGRFDALKGLMLGHKNCHIFQKIQAQTFFIFLIFQLTGNFRKCFVSRRGDLPVGSIAHGLWNCWSSRLGRGGQHCKGFRTSQLSIPSFVCLFIFFELRNINTEPFFFSSPRNINQI